MTRRSRDPIRSPRRGASLVTYATVIGLVALGVSIALSQTGDGVSGFTTRVAGSVNAVDGALSGNKGPVFQGTLPEDQAVDAHDPIAPLAFLGFSDPEGDRLSYRIEVTGPLPRVDLSAERRSDGLVVTGTPTAGGTVSVVATDPIGRTAVAGTVTIDVAPNQAPVIDGPPADMTIARDGVADLRFTNVYDPDGDDLAYEVVGLPGGSAVAETGGVRIDVPVPFGTHEVRLVAKDAHDLATTSDAVTVTGAATTCADHLARDPAAGDGRYPLDPDGAAATPPVEMTCDMTRDGGGWTLAVEFDQNSATTTVDQRPALQPYIDAGITDLETRTEVVAPTRTYKRFLKNSRYVGRYSGLDTYFASCKLSWSGSYAGDDHGLNQSLTSGFQALHSTCAGRGPNDWRCNVVTSCHRSLRAADGSLYTAQHGTFFGDPWYAHCGGLRTNGNGRVEAVGCARSHTFSPAGPEGTWNPGQYREWPNITTHRIWIK